MNDSTASSSPLDSATGRCPTCDYKVTQGDTVCLMCGASLAPALSPSTEAALETDSPTPADQRDEPAVEHRPAAERSSAPDDGGAGAAAGSAGSPVDAPPPTAAPVNMRRIEQAEPQLPDVVPAIMRERQSPVVTVMVLLFVGVTALLGSLTLQITRDSPVAALVFPTLTPIPPTPTYTPTITPVPSATPPPTETEAPSVTPQPSSTSPPPRLHSVSAGETLFLIGYVYNVGPESIAALNDLSENPVLQVDQELLVPWPTPTPPLTAVILELDGQTFIADPDSCERYEIQANDSLIAIAQRFEVDFRALQAVNRITENSAPIRPGDTICIPAVSFYDGELPPTPGPSPTPTSTPPPVGPRLLYPPDGAAAAPPAGPFVLQWLAVKDLAPDEWYMVELVDLDDVDAYPRRGFVRDNSLTVPPAWRPQDDADHTIRWTVSIVRVTGVRSDGAFIYTYGGGSSVPRIFVWLGEIPTPTQTPTLTPAASGS